MNRQDAESAEEEKMNWQEIRTQYPHRWLVCEAVGAYTEGAERVIPRLEVVGVFEDDWHPAWARYKQLHAEDKWREYYVLHTDREALNIGVIDAFGRVVSHRIMVN